MAARPPGASPLPETVDSFTDETAPPQKSPLRGALPFAIDRPAPPPAEPSGEETAPPQRSPLAAALPFRHAKPSPSTVAIPAPTAEDLRRLAQPGAGNTPSSAPAAEAHPSHAPPPAGGGPVVARSTGHFGLSIEQYAALCAEVAVHPQTADATFAKYGLAARKDRMAADLGWQELLRADPALMARWQSLYLHYHQHHSRAAGR